MRVGIVTTSYPRAGGDPSGAFVASHARWLAGAGHTVEVVAVGPGAAVVGGIPVLRVPGWGLVGGEGAPDRLERAPWALAAALPITLALAARVTARVGTWDAICAHWLAPAGLVSALVSRGRPLLVVAHGGDVHLLARPGLADAALIPLERAGARLVVSAPHLLERLRAAVRTRRVRGWLEGALVSPMGADAAPTWTGGPARATVLYLGRLAPIKGVEVLLEACARVAPAPALLIAGDGPERRQLEASALRLGLDAEFLGTVPTHARAALFARASVLALPSRPIGGRTEGTPVVALEAMAARLPIVASSTGGIPAALGAWPGATLVAPDDPAALAGALARTLARTGLAPPPPDLTWAAVGPRLGAHWLDRPTI